MSTFLFNAFHELEARAHCHDGDATSGLAKFASNPLRAAKKLGRAPVDSVNFEDMPTSKLMQSIANAILSLTESDPLIRAVRDTARLYVPAQAA